MNMNIKNLKTLSPRILFGLCLMLAVPLHAAEEEHEHTGHDHEDHSGHDHGDEDAGHDAHAAEEEHEHTGHDHEDHSGQDHGDGKAGHDPHAGHDHTAEEEHDHSGHDHEDHSGHDHGDEKAGHDPHAGHDHAAEEEHDHAGHDHEDHSGHDHGEEGGIEISDTMMQKLGIQLREAKGGVVSVFSTFPAEIKLNRDRAASVSPRFPSIVRQVFAEIGEDVKKGDVLASLENRETMAVYTVSAPQDGMVIHKDLAVGETAGEENVLYRVADLSSVWADVSIFPKHRESVETGTEVTFMANGGQRIKGKVKYISPIVSHETRTYTARCVLENVGNAFAPGSFVRASIAVRQTEAAVAVPLKAVQRIEGENVVFIPGDHGFVAAPVKTGAKDDALVEILSGLKAGEPYVAEGAFSLKAQMITSGMDPHAGHGH